MLFFWMTSYFHTMGPMAIISMTLCLEEVCPVAIPVGCQTATVFGQVHQNVALGAMFAVYI